MRAHPAHAPSGKFHAIPAAYRRLETIWLEPLRLHPPDDAGEQRHGVRFTFELRPADDVADVGLGVGRDERCEAGRKFATLQRHRAVHADGVDDSALLRCGLVPDLTFRFFAVIPQRKLQRDVC